MVDRMKWVESKLSTVVDPSLIEVHIDEKWFTSFHRGGIVIVPPGIQLRPKAVVSKRHPAQQMFLAAIAEPRREHNFNGKIALIPVTERVVAKRSTRTRNTGDEYEKPITLTKQRFLHMVKTLVVPSAVSRVFEWSRTIKIQMDNAGGHGGGRSDMAHGTLLELQTWYQCLSDDEKLALCPFVPPSRWPLIIFVSQPARSPDLNALDLGAWWSLEKAVGEITQKSDEETWIEAVQRRVMEAWNQWNAEDKCCKIFSSLKLVWAKIKEVNGGNCFVIPHQLEK